MSGVLTEAVSLVAGLVTGFFFEHRAARSARRDKEELMRQVSALRTRVRSLGGVDAADPQPPPRDLAGLVTEWAIAKQDSSGRVQRQAVVAHFLERGHAARDIEAAISSLCRAGITKEEGRWLQMMK